MAAIQLAVATALSRVARFIVSILIEAEDARIAIAIGDKDGAIRGRQGRRNPPFIGGLETGFRRSRNLQHDAAIGFHLQEEPVVRGRALLHRGIYVFFVALGKDERVNLGICGSDLPEQVAFGAVDENAGVTLRADVDISGLVLGYRAMRATEPCT